MFVHSGCFRPVLLYQVIQALSVETVFSALLICLINRSSLYLVTNNFPRDHCNVPSKHVQNLYVIAPYFAASASLHSPL